MADYRNFITKLNIFKITNAIKIILSFWLSKFLNLPVQWGRPFTISIEPTTACNLGCPECPSGLKQFTRPQGNLSIKNFKEWMNEFHNSLIYLYFYFQGEPFIHSSFLELVSHAHNKGIYTVTSTNGHFLNDATAKRTVESGLDRLIISIDGTTQATYESYRRNGSLKKVLDGARNIVRWKKTLKSSRPYTIFQFLVVGHNEHQMEEVKKLAKEIGIDEVKFKTAQIYDYQNGSGLIPKNDKYSRYYKRSDGTYRIKNELLNHCWKLWHSCVITWDGKVVPCCFDKDASHQLGDLSTMSFKDIWQGNPYTEFRRKILSSRKEIDICTNCTEGTKVWTSI